MSEEYLWDKSGSDPEIERLETVLGNFAYKEIDPPPMPANVLTLPEARPRWYFGLRMAFATAFVAVLCLGLGAYVLVQKRKPPEQILTVAQPQDGEPLPAAIRDSEPKIEPAVTVPSAERKRFIPVRQDAAPQRRAAVKSVQRTVRREPEVKFTNEELHAYNQLMLALSITSSKLKIVNDKVNGSDGQGSDTADSR